MAIVRYRYRVYPAPVQEQALARVFGCVRVVYNDVIEVRQDAHKRGEKPLEVRSWTCPGCGTEHDRDLNAARNVLAEGRRIAAGLAEIGNACGGDVRPGQVLAVAGEAGTHRGAA